MYSHPSGIHFLAMPRTGSKAVREALKTRGFVIHGGHHDISQFDKLVKPGDIVMSTLRNHFDWFVSFWYLGGCPGRFERFVPEFCRKSEWISRNPDYTRCTLYWKYAPRSNRLLRYNHLGEDLNAALLDHGIEPVDLEQNGPRKPRPYQSYYRPATRQYIEKRFHDELSQLGFSF